MVYINRKNQFQLSTKGAQRDPIFRALLRTGTLTITAKADGTKLQPFIVFKGAKREAKSLNEEFKTHCVIVTSSNGWMNTDLTIEYTRKVLESFSFGRRFLAWDSYECHMDSNVATSLKSAKIDQAIIPGGCTKFIQAPDVSWNKPFKAMCTEKYDQWLAEEGIYNETAECNLKAPPRKRVVEWILDSWKSLPAEIIKRSFKSCALNINVDGSEDDVIHCFKESQPCAAGREMLKSQMEVSKDLADETNPFLSISVTNSDVEEAGNDFFILDEDDSDDELIDVEEV